MFYYLVVWTDEDGMHQTAFYSGNSDEARRRDRQAAVDFAKAGKTPCLVLSVSNMIASRDVLGVVNHGLDR